MATQIQQRRPITHNPAVAAAGALIIVVGLIVGALIIGSLSRGNTTQPVWELTGRGVAVERPGTNGPLRFAIEPTRASSVLNAERYAVQSGFLEAAGDGSYNIAAAQYLCRLRYAVKHGFLEATGDGAVASSMAPVTRPGRAPLPAVNG